MAAILLLVGTAAAAHQDPLGEVHPRVVVEKNQFVVYFTDNRERRLYRMTFSQRGAVIGQRQAASRSEMYDDEEARGNPIHRRVGDDRYTFSRWKDVHAGSPFYFLERSGHAPRRVPLPWGKHKVDIVHDAVVGQQDIVLLVTPELHLFRFAKSVPAGTAVASTRLGVPYRIYDFPRASNIAPFRAGYVVCWIDVDQRMLVTYWEPRTGRAKTTPLLPKTDWNTTISIGVIGDALLVTYHGFGARRTSEIKTILRKLPL